MTLTFETEHNGAKKGILPTKLVFPDVGILLSKMEPHFGQLKFVHFTLCSCELIARKVNSDPVRSRGGVL